MSPELYWMAATAVLTALLWVPYILGFIAAKGPVYVLTARQGREVEPAWCARGQQAHTNAVENLVVFAVLAIGVHVAGVGNGATAVAAMAYFWLRLAHYVVMLAGIPVVRTLIFAGGVVCQLVLGYALLTGNPASG